MYPLFVSCICIMTSDFKKNLFMCLLAICVISLEKSLCRFFFFAHFNLIRLFVLELFVRVSFFRIKKNICVCMYLHRKVRRQLVMLFAPSTM